MERKFEYKGTLKETPFLNAAMLLIRYRVPAIVHITSDHINKAVFFENGEIIYAVSNLKDDLLGERLLKNGLLTIDQYKKACEMLKLSEGKKKLGQILVDMDLLTPNRLFYEIKRQVEDIIISLFNIRQGKILVTLGHFDKTEISILRLKTRSLIYRGIKNSFSQVDIKNYLQSESKILRPTPKFNEILKDESFGPAEQKILQLIDGKSTVKDICLNSPISPSETCKFLAFLLIMEIVS